MLKKCCLNVDWLQLNCRVINHESLTNEYPLIVKKMDCYSSTWEQLLEVHHIQLNRQVATVALKPRMKSIDQGTVLLKFDNWFLYQHSLATECKSILNLLGLTVHNISRIDLALDFNQFDNGWHPKKLIDGFVSNKYLKKGRGKFKLIGNHNRQIDFEYIRFGSRESQVSYYLYNKSLELLEEKMKPWIYDCWELVQLDKNNVWRLEFSVKCGSEAITLDDAAENVLKFPDVLEREFIVGLYVALLDKYFTFYKNVA